MPEQHTADRLEARDYERVFRVLERVDTARSVADFSEQALEALEVVLGYRDTTFFCGPTYDSLFDDVDPLAHGRTQAPALEREYRAGWRDEDVFCFPEMRAVLARTNAASTIEAHHVPRRAHGYLSHLARHGLHSVNALYLRPGGDHALIGVFGPDRHLVGPNELAVLRLLGRQLSALSRGLERTQRSSGGMLRRLAPRQQEVAELVCDGLSNASIGRTLALTEDTVKKYVSRILAETGVRSRTELVVALRCDGGPA